MPLNSNYQSIEYQSRTKLLELAELAATTSKKDKKSKYLQQAAKIRYFLKATALGTSYLTVDELNNIYQCLIVITGIQDYPVAPNLPSVSVPTVGAGPAGPQGVSITSVANIAGDLIVYLSDGTTINAGPLPAGADGTSGSIPFAVSGATTGTVDVDTFDYSLSKGVRWDYVLDNGVSRRVGSIYATWLADGTIATLPLEFHSDAVGTTAADTEVTFDANISGSFIKLQAVIASSTWSVQGLRTYLPANASTSGSGTLVLPNTQVYIGNASDEAQARSLSGAITVSNTGVTTLGSSVVANANVAPAAAIAVNKLAALTATRIVTTDASGFLAVTTLTEAAITAAIASIAGKQDTITGGATSITSANLTPTRALVSDASGKVAVHPTATTTNLSSLDTTTSLTTQLAAKLAKTLTEHSLFVGDASNEASEIAVGAEGSFLRVDAGTPTWQKIVPVTSVITPSLGTSYQSTAENYSVISCNVQIVVDDEVGTEEGEVALEVAPTSGGTYVIAGIFELRTVYSMVGDTVLLQQTNQLVATVPTGYYWRLRTVTNTAATITVRDCIETVF